MTTNKLSAALYIEDFNELKNIHDALKKAGVEAHFYESLESLWHGLIKSPAQILIVDIKHISEGELLLSDHPFIRNESITLGLYFSEKTGPLMLSSHIFDDFVPIMRHFDYTAKVQALVKKATSQSAIEVQIKGYKKLIDQKDLEVKNAKNAVVYQEQVLKYQSLVKSVCLEFEKLRRKVDFNVAVESIFQEMNEIESFTTLELSFNGQKLTSAISSSDKFHTIPSIWLGKTSTAGIETFAQNMAMQVLMEQMAGGYLVSLLIKGKEDQVERMICVKTSHQAFYNHFDWDVLEAYLNGFLATSENLESPYEVDTKKVRSSFEALSLVDQFLYGQTASEAQVEKFNPNLKLINLDLSDLIEKVLKRPKTRFFWSRFLTDFVNKFEIQSGYTFKYFDFGVNQISFFVEDKNFQNFYDQLKEYSKNFGYWKYFENSDGALSILIEPKISMVPLSAYAYLLKDVEIQKNFLSLIENKEQNKQKGDENDEASKWTYISRIPSLDM